MKITHFGVWLVLVGALAGVAPAKAQSKQTIANDDYVAQVRQGTPWEFGPFVQGGVGIGARSDFGFFSFGLHGGKVLTDPIGPGFLRGQFDYAGEIMPFWQAYTPAPHLAPANTTTTDGGTTSFLAPVGGGTYTGVSITPIILRWNFHGTKRIRPWFQG